MRQQIGWYNSETERTCTMDQKRVAPIAYETYTLPVFFDDDLPESEATLRLLENQCALLSVAFNLIMGTEFEGLRKNLVNARKRTIEILEKARQARENDPRKS